MKKVSYSQFSLYHQCPNRWKLDYIDGLRTHEQSIHTIFGSSIHEAIQHWLQVIYNDSVKAGNAVDFNTMLKESLMTKYKQSIMQYHHQVRYLLQQQHELLAMHHQHDPSSLSFLLQMKHRC